jgi:hypothetical protein
VAAEVMTRVRGPLGYWAHNTLIEREHIHPFRDTEVRFEESLI